MEMEHINEHTIRVTIKNSDLEERGITVLDLLGNQTQIENFFYSILEEVDIEDKFQESEMVTFQVVPSKHGLELYISKDGHDADHFSLSDLLSEDEINMLQDQENKSKRMPEEASMNLPFEDLDNELQYEVSIKFTEFEDLVQLAQAYDIDDGLSFLHDYEDDYYLTLIYFLEDRTKEEVLDELMIVYEYGETTTRTFAFLDEHGSELMRGNALELLRYYFD